ncbi:hypothetical protein B0I37DRAFT_420104 [Chaetomium sp. MPI-CAGE-AT-0009]|nr:hypothetical protein B0I37DRAFT_420104 [Chaetomium sp. MPI-CAGE-AT-0009]
MDVVRQLDGSLRGLSTSQVAALIAFGTFAAQLLLSFIWPLVLVGFISKQESAVTWSVVGRVIHNSYWPAILQTDATATTGVRRRVSAVSWGVALGGVLVGIAGIITPLGLYEEIVPSNDPTPIPFKYSPDLSPFGLGTVPRHDSLGFSRRCVDYRFSDMPAACPHSNQRLTIIMNDTYSGAESPGGYDTRIPKNVYQFFQSGTSRLGRTVSSLFDIEYRTYGTSRDSAQKFYQNGSQFLAVEGLVVDTQKGGIGFRNDTIPANNLDFGAQWTEDLLFIEPVTECTNLNLALDFNIPFDGYVLNAYTTQDVGNLSIVDHGGFVDINRTHPLHYDASHGQEDPQLAYRSYIGAWASNALMMYYLNITKPVVGHPDQEPFPYLDSEHGKTFRLPSLNTTNTTTVGVNSISTSGDWDFLGVYWGPSAPLNSSLGTPGAGWNFEPPNPWKITRDNFTEIKFLCGGELGTNAARINDVGSTCGLVTGIPQRSDGSDSIHLTPGSRWTVPLYNCASTTRAVIKTVSFSVNNTDDLAGLRIVNITEKQYQDSSEYPVWAVEDVERRLFNTKPLWGLVESETAPFGNISFKRHPHLWLSGHDILDEGGSTQNLPGLHFYSMALGVAYSVDEISSYSGGALLPMQTRWKELSKSAEGTATLINLIWTDVSANAVVGTHGQMPRTEPPGLGPAYVESRGEKQKRADPDTTILVPVHLFSRRVQYKIPYAIPAFLALALILGTLGFILVAVVSRGAGPRSIRWFLQRLSAGRLMTATLLDEDDGGYAAGDAASKDKWLDGPGGVKVDISGRAPRIEKEVPPVGSSGSVSEGGDVAPGMGTNPSSRMLEM